MTILIKFKHKGEAHELSLAKAAQLLNMAESTFSGKWRQNKLMARTDQECFDNVKRYRKKANKKRRHSNCPSPTEAVSIRKEEAFFVKQRQYFALFNYGSAI